MIISHKHTYVRSFQTLVLVISLISLHYDIVCRIGCISNGAHLGDKNVRRRYDTKEYHYVQCNCPCVMLLGKKQTCAQCGHRHDQRRLIIIDSNSVTASTNKNARTSSPLLAHTQNPEQSQDPRRAIEQLVKRKRLKKP